MIHVQSKVIAFWLLFGIVFAILPYISVAQEKTEDGVDVIYITDEEVAAMREEALEAAVVPEGLNSCFEYYDFGNVAVVPELELTSTVPGATIGVPLTIHNKNSHPIVNGMVYVKVFKVRDSENIQFGDDLVDQFVALENVVLPPGDRKYGAFEWQIPTNAESGTYKIATYFISAERFNLEGLSFTDDIIGGSVEISVRDDAEGEGAVRFDRESVTVNGEVHEFATFMSVFDETSEKVEVKAVVNNTTDTSYEGVVTWTLYGWDGLRAETMLDTKSESIRVDAESTKQVAYAAVGVERTYPVYYLIGELKNGDSKSIIDVRYVHVQTDTKWARFNDVGVNAYPLDGNAVAYACFQGFSGSSGVFPEGRVEVEVRAPGFFGPKIIGEGVYEGVVHQDFVALPVRITSQTEDLVVSASLYIQGKLIDVVEMEYSCEDLTPGLCMDKGSGGTLYAIIVTVLALLLGGAVLVLYRHVGGGGSVITNNNTQSPGI